MCLRCYRGALANTEERTVVRCMSGKREAIVRLEEILRQGGG
jgi:hypothetical protein